MKALVVSVYRLIKKLKTLFYSTVTRVIVSEFGQGSCVNNASRFPPETRIGKDCHFNGTTVLGRGGLTVGDHFHSGINLLILTDTHNFRSGTLPYDNTFIPGPVTVGEYVWTGVNVTILPGVVIGDRAIIGAGSVVTKDVPADTIVAGNPARKIGTR